MVDFLTTLTSLAYYDKNEGTSVLNSLGLQSDFNYHLAFKISRKKMIVKLTAGLRKLPSFQVAFGEEIFSRIHSFLHTFSNQVKI